MQQDDIDSANDIKIDKYDISNKNSSLKIDLNEKKDNNNNFEDIIVSNKVKKDKINLNKDFWVFTGSSVGVVPIKSKGIYIGKIDKLGSVKTQIR